MLNQSIESVASTSPGENRREIRQIFILAKPDFAVDGMVSLLEGHRNIYKVTVADPANFTPAQIQAIRPDVLMLNSNVNPDTIDNQIREIHAASKNTIVLMFGHGMSDAYLYQAMRAGARGYLNERMRGDHITTALDTVLSGGYWAERNILCQFISDKSAHDKIEANVSSLSARLTTRESEVLELILEGMTTNEIAERIYLSHQGVKAHLTNLFRKFDVKNRAQLILSVLNEVSPIHSLSALIEKGLRISRTPNTNTKTEQAA
jgi:DNA-binding NarL/FixJ family response regulator